MWWIYPIIAAVVVLIAAGIPVIRALRFRPKKEEAYPDFPVRCDEDKAVADLAAMVRCRTVSDTDESK